ncbi:MAG: FAD-binding protein, partial [Coriobacteriaceae bacterium]|nr:FAD-binding protein [Coriobacteriaceae bacterium]
MNKQVKDTEMKGLSRRNFLTGAAVVGAAAFTGALAGCAPQSSSNNNGTDSEVQPIAASTLPEKWDKEADVVVVGYGGAGAAAAWEALQAGATTIILEQGERAGGSTN